MVAVQNQSKFMLFGFDVDPWQSLPVLLIGALMGLLGIRAADYLQGVINKRKAAANVP